MRGLFVYAVYVVVVSAALLRAVSAIGGGVPVAEITAPTAYTMISVSLIDGSPEQTVFCSAATNSVTADSLVFNSQADLEKLLRDLGCAP